jgi:SAM-dependent methyltransferase
MILKIKKLARKILPQDFIRIIKRILLKYYSLTLKGNNIYCPVCDKSFKKFINMGIDTVNELHCPNCNSIGRDRLLWLYFQSKTDMFTRECSLFEIAPVECFSDKFIPMQNLNYVSGDLYSTLAMVKLDIKSLPFDDESFDYLICSHVLEHIDDDKKAISELYRILKKSGIAFILNPVDYSKEVTYEDDNIKDPKERFIHFGQEDHVRIYGKDFPKRLSNCGFEVEESEYASSLSKQDSVKYGINSNEIIYVCNKSRK